MKHAQQAHISARRPPDTFVPPPCPLCRQSSRLISVWKQVDPQSTATQLIQGIEVPNLLERRRVPGVHRTIAARRTQSDEARRRSSSGSSSHSSERIRRRNFRLSVRPGTRPPATQPTTTSAEPDVAPEPVQSTEPERTVDASEEAVPTPVNTESWEEVAGSTETYTFGQFTTEMCNSPCCCVGLPKVQQAYLQSTELASGKPGLLVDIGSIGNLAGDAWARTVSKACGRLGWRPEVTERNKPLRVHGVGTQPSEAKHDVKLPIGIKKDHGRDS